MQYGDGGHPQVHFLMKEFAVPLEEVDAASACFSKWKRTAPLTEQTAEDRSKVMSMGNSPRKAHLYLSTLE